MDHLRLFDYIGNFGSDLMVLLLGILILTRQFTGWFILYLLTLLICIILPIHILLNTRSGAKPAETSDLFLILFDILFAAAIVFQPQTFIRWIHVFFGWWMFAQGAISLIDFYVLFRDQMQGALPRLLSGIVSMTLAWLMILGTNLSIKTNILSLIAGIYFIVYGVVGLLFHFFLMRKRKHPQSFSFSYSLPVLLNAFIPLKAYMSIKKLKHESRLEIPGSTEPADLFVYVYMKGKGPEIFGHIDLSYHGMILSYGNHDPQSRRLNGTYGDGVLIRAKEKEFLQESITTDGKTVIGYGIRLSDEQKQLLESRIRNLFSRTIPWKCAAEKAHDSGKDMSSCKDYASRVYRETFCEMFKFTHGKFRTYFISSTNCVMLADELIRSPSLNLIRLNGIVTPGTYLSFLNTEYLKPGSPVITRVLYEAGVHEAL